MAIKDPEMKAPYLQLFVNGFGLGELEEDIDTASI